jgi:UDP-glucose 4-epimerase
VVYAERRPGDPPELVATSRFAKEILGWEPEYKDIRDIIRTAWDWEKKKRY